MDCPSCGSTMELVDSWITWDKEDNPWRVMRYQCACGMTDTKYIPGRLVDSVDKKRKQIEFD
jgi:hypothetical protein